ncbi:MAG: YhcB family protein [Pseudomonadota bacterium]
MQVEYGNINWILAFACLVAGGGFGAMGYHLAGGGANRRQRLRRQLAERERELTQLRERLSEHFTEVTSLVSRLQRESQALEQRLADDAAALGEKAPAERRGLEVIADDAAAPTVPTPRDYADGSGGTLSEDFGLKPSAESAAEPQPPRY